MLDDPLFDVQSHSYSHRMLRDSPQHGPGVSLEDAEFEIAEGKRLVDEVFECDSIGFRPGCGFENGFCGDWKLPNDAPKPRRLSTPYFSDCSRSHWNVWINSGLLAVICR